jgi:cell division protein FtsI/penicillin-binding protein 2
MIPAALVLLSFLRMDVQTGSVLERQWQDERPIHPGSLVKPFIALAYAQSHQFRFPEINCTRCWLPRGHGRIGLRDAIAQSCNSYFDTLRAALGPGELDAVARRFGLRGVDEARPEELLGAFVELSRRSAEPGVSVILEGMRLAARAGTAKRLAHDALAKTGTAPCTHTPKAPGDGFVVVLYPAVQPRVALLARLHGRPGSYAAAEAARLIQ